jgi:hypothetical protein
LNIPHQLQQTLTVDQLNSLALSELSRITRELADADDLDAIGAVVCDKTPHFANRRHFDLTRPPLLALD